MVPAYEASRAAVANRPISPISLAITSPRIGPIPGIVLRSLISSVSEDVLTEIADARYGKGNISYFAFTATPKPKTMQLFGTQQEDGSYMAFHTYPMRQAIEEGFILDVLKGYIPYKVAHKLAHDGVDYGEDEVDKSEASKALSRWVRLHPYNIARKVQIIVEHFREHVADRLAGEVNDRESSEFPLTEHNMNPGLGGEDIRNVIDQPEYQVLIVQPSFRPVLTSPNW